jgi:hypothetical protein
VNEPFELTTVAPASCSNAAALPAAVASPRPVIFCEFIGTAPTGGCCVAITSRVPVAMVGAIPVPPMTMEVSAAETVPTVPVVVTAVSWPLAL